MHDTASARGVADGSALHRAAGAALVPASALLTEPEVAATRSETAWTDDTLRVLADRYGVSREAVLPQPPGPTGTLRELVVLL